ncbi:hypothetical protein GIB67_036425 [Kingdonia uniflora]|uniref:Germin-like protein n=1 Tax=Kingdonia uniflora TaxID=39325 RepID=A0A7J7L4B0_9MAGN|nr:hypothetical protein GIB67_036425 [Kingdonia uniflora]
MGLNFFQQSVIFFLVIGLSASPISRANDPDIISDFIIPPSSNATIDGNFFTYTGKRGLLNFSTILTTLKLTKASMNEFPALNGQIVSMALLQIPEGGLNPPHVNSRSAGLLFMLDGCIEVGLVDTANKFYKQNLCKGDMFLFPKGLVHSQFNAYAKGATAVAAFASAIAGTFQIPGSVFTSGIDDDVLAKSFKTDAETIQKIKDGLA